ncbi:MAG: hypothetical protein A3G03_00530 [Candidatus Taylorbacteria bacterium RIFCSPLOWO2_12_FULL_44_15c]|uniref:DNA polymerase III delta N-terminal domain-containing protein n=1 Tax=Candidatus Taylorbacteria bacterium RIFCSPLOWO2_12_FULL_44_15c TaxID=1802333 RepID=A0A1G2P6V1_9BACT|nr:MAG: hypothetical protein A3G03_00530 [Candidatus Taylorbacteria bacterium RIFCSPLOWO2_12_FULL_44_15c]
MLYLIYGNDFEKARGKARELIADLQKRKPNAEVFRLEDEMVSAGKLDELSGGQGLFERKYIVFADNVFRSAEAKEIVLKKLKSLADSENVFIFLEDELGKADLKELEKFAKKVQKFSGATNKEKPFNVFSLTEKLGRRDKRGLWILYQKALAEGLAPEEIHGILFWQIKAMLAAVLAKTAEESGLKPFVFQKSRVFAKNYSLAELKNLSSKMVAVYHNSRRIGPDLDVALERLILEI